MDQETRISPKAVVMRSWIVLFLIGMGLRIFHTTVGDAPIAAAAQGQVTTPAPAESALPAAQPGHTSGAVTIVRVEWLDGCEGGQTQLGLYASGDAPCHPRRAVSLSWLQSQLASAGLLAGGEYLDQAINPSNATCLAQVLSGPTAQLAGWLCADARGLYRAAPNGQAPDARFQLWIQGR